MGTDWELQHPEAAGVAHEALASGQLWPCATVPYPLAWPGGCLGGGEAAVRLSTVAGVLCSAGLWQPDVEVRGRGWGLCREGCVKDYGVRPVLRGEHW